jgi:hypothetical protein
MQEIKLLEMPNYRSTGATLREKGSPIALKRRVSIKIGGIYGNYDETIGNSTRKNYFTSK